MMTSVTVKWHPYVADPTAALGGTCFFVIPSKTASDLIRPYVSSPRKSPGRCFSWWTADMAVMAPWIIIDLWWQEAWHTHTHTTSWWSPDFRMMVDDPHIYIYTHIQVWWHTFLWYRFMIPFAYPTTSSHFSSLRSPKVWILQIRSPSRRRKPWRSRPRRNWRGSIPMEAIPMMPRWPLGRWELGIARPLALINSFGFRVWGYISW